MNDHSVAAGGSQGTVLGVGEGTLGAAFGFDLRVAGLSPGFLEGMSF